MLFDEIETAHPDVWNILLQILEDGQITDSLSRKVDFRNTIIIMTSNVGAEYARKVNTLGFGIKQDDADYDAMKEKMLEQAKKTFKPEFLNRLDDIIVFHSLTRDDLSQIVHIEVDKVAERIKARGITIKLTAEATEFLIEKGYDPAYGARPLRRAVERYLEDPMAEEILRGSFTGYSLVVIGKDGERLTFTPQGGEKKEAKDDPPPAAASTGEGEGKSPKGDA